MTNANKHRYSLIATVLYCLFILPFTESISFTNPTSRKTLALSYALKMLFGICFYFSVFFCLSFYAKLRAKDRVFTNWIKYSAICLLVLMLFFVIMYPGHWVADELRIVDSVKNYSLGYTWQNFFTNIFYTFCMYLIPTAVSIVFVQIVFAAITIGYLVSHAQRLFKHSALAYWLFVPFLFFPVIINDLYPLRGIMYSYLELLLIARLIFHYKGLYKKSNRYLEFIKFTLLITLVGFWRPEGVYYLVLIPVLIYKLKLFPVSKNKGFSYVAILLSCVIVLAGYVITKETSSSKYQLTAFVNPLSTMIQKPLHGQNVKARLADMDQTLDINLIKQYPSYVEIPSFWMGAVRPGYSLHMRSFIKQYVYIVIHNPGAFMYNRMRTFLSTNSFYSSPSMNKSRFSGDYMLDPMTARFVNSNHFSKPINIGIKEKVEDFLMCLRGDGAFNFLAHIVYNAIIPMAILLIGAIYCVLKRKWFWVFIIGLILFRVPLVFLTAPANYFFYYLPVYVVGYFLIFLLVLMGIDRRKTLK